MIDSPPARRRLLGAALRRYRENMGFGLDDAARVLECDRSKISRIETGQRGIRPKELRELLTEYGVGEQEQGALAAIAHTARAGAWWEEYGDVLTGPFRDYLAMEVAAAEILLYDAQQVPDLLQTPEYAHALAGADPSLPAAGTQSRIVELKLARQQAILSCQRPELTVLIGEGALRQLVGGAEVLRGQLRRLARIGSDFPEIILQVVPFACGAHAGGGSGPVAILRFAEAAGVGVVHLAGLSGGICLVSQPDVAAYTGAFEQLRTSALTPGASVRLLWEMAS
ncbi:MAG: helix-turn-helix domain-containing protein [Streptosporangiaceae bacterium]